MGWGMPDSSMPSSMLEHEAHMFGFRERASPRSDIGSPQQMQILGFIFPTTRAGLDSPRLPGRDA